MLPRSHPALISFSCASDKLRGHAVRKASGEARMTRRRLRWIAVQAIVVTALAVIVVLTLLKPESQSPLSPISGEGTPPIVQGPAGGPEGGDGDGSRGDGDRKPGGDGDGERGDRDDADSDEDGQAPPTGTASTSVGGSPLAPTPVTPDSSTIRPEGGFEGESEDESPSDDQYSSTLGAIDSALR